MGDARDAIVNGHNDISSDNKDKDKDRSQVWCRDPLKKSYRLIMGEPIVK